MKYIQNNSRSLEGTVEFVITEENEDGSCWKTFITPYYEEVDGSLRRRSIQEYNSKMYARGPVNTFNIVKGDVNVYLRAYYVSTTRNGWAGRFFRPVSGNMKCTYTGGTVTSAYVGLGLAGELYNLDVAPLNR